MSTLVQVPVKHLFLDLLILISVNSFPLKATFCTLIFAGLELIGRLALTFVEVSMSNELIVSFFKSFVGMIPLATSK